MPITRKMRLWGGVGLLAALVSLCSGLGIWHVHTIAATTRTLIETSQVEREAAHEAEISSKERSVLRSLSFVTPLLLVPFGAAISIGPVVAFFSVQSFSRPIDRLVASVQALAEGDLTARVAVEDVQQKDELGQIGTAINLLAEKLHDGMTHVAQAVSAVVVSAQQLSTTATHL